MSRPARYAAAIFALSAGALAIALAAQFWGGLQPCELCLYQRWPYDAVLAGAAAALLLAPSPGSRVLLALCGVIFAAGTTLALYHVGVEQGWWDGPTACSAALPRTTTLDELRASLAAQPVVDCRQPAWRFRGVTMAGLNIAASALLAALCVAGARRPPQRRVSR